MTTNYETIKSMSINEMAEWLQMFSLDALCQFCCGCDDEDEEIGCIKGVVKWLQQETE